MTRPGKSSGKRDSKPGSSAVEADSLTPMPTRWSAAAGSLVITGRKQVQAPQCLAQADRIYRLPAPVGGPPPSGQPTAVVVFVSWLVNSFLAVNGTCRSPEELFSEYIIHVNVIPNFKAEMCIPLKPIPRKDTLRG